MPVRGQILERDSEGPMTTDALGRLLFGSGGMVGGGDTGEAQRLIRQYRDGQDWLQIAGDPSNDPRLAPFAEYDPQYGWIAPQNKMAELNPEPSGFGDKWGAFPMLAAVIGGAYMAPAAAEGAAATGAAGGASVPPASYWNMVSGEVPQGMQLYQPAMQMGAGATGAAAGTAAEAAGLSLPSLSTVAQGASVLGGAAALSNALSGGDSGPVFDIYGANAADPTYYNAAMNNTGALTGQSLNDYSGVMNPAGVYEGAPVMNGMNWGQLGSAATGMANVANAAKDGGITIPQGLINSALPAAATLGGAALAANSANRAIDAQTAGTSAALDATGKAAQDAIAEQRRQYDLNRADYAPYREAGNQAVGRIGGMLAPGGDLTRKFTVGDFYADPVTQLSMDFGLSEGRKALERAARANGSLNAGGTLKALTRYGTDYAGQKANESYNRFYGDQDRTFNRNASLAGLGQTATAGTVNAGQNSANNIAGITTNQGNTIGNLYSSLGNSRGAASIAQGNTFNNALSNIGNWWTNQNMLDTLMSGRR